MRSVSLRKSGFASVENKPDIVGCVLAHAHEWPTLAPLAYTILPTTNFWFSASRTRSGSYLTRRPTLRNGIARLFFWL
jgi:hypothetical protein